MRFDGKRALVTGGTRGIGQAIQRCLTARGCQVIVTGRAQEAPEEPGVEYLPLDVATSDGIAAFAAEVARRHDSLDILVNNAGINIIEGIEDVSEDHWQQVLQVDLTAPMVLTKRLLPLLRKSAAGRVLNVSSIWGVISKERRVSYSAAKTGLIGLTRAMALELGRDGILVNALCPGFTATDLTARSLTADEMAALAERIPLGRFAAPFEIAAAAAFLCSDLNAYITGQAIVADGGFTIQ